MWNGCVCVLTVNADDHRLHADPCTIEQCFGIIRIMTFQSGMYVFVRSVHQNMHVHTRTNSGSSDWFHIHLNGPNASCRIRVPSQSLLSTGNYGTQYSWNLFDFQKCFQFNWFSLDFFISMKFTPYHRCDLNRAKDEYWTWVFSPFILNLVHNFDWSTVNLSHGLNWYIAIRFSQLGWHYETEMWQSYDCCGVVARFGCILQFDV